MLWYVTTFIVDAVKDTFTLVSRTNQCNNISCMLPIITRMGKFNPTLCQNHNSWLSSRVVTPLSWESRFLGNFQYCHKYAQKNPIFESKFLHYLYVLIVLQHNYRFWSLDFFFFIHSYCKFSLELVRKILQISHLGTSAIEIACSGSLLVKLYTLVGKATSWLSLWLVRCYVPLSVMTLP